MNHQKVILSGDRPTGPLHLGHYVGALKARLDLQCEAQSFFLIADLQALTDNQGRHQKVTANVVNVAMDYLACGLDPNKSHMVIQSQLPALSELTQLFSNQVNVSRLERNPTIRREIELRGFERDVPSGFLMYPVSQAADILAFKATHVPVGEDQLPMIELANEMAGKCNRLVDQEIFQICTPVLSSVKRLVGIDGKNKMSKSLGNAIALSATPDEIKQAVQKMYTDPLHIKISDPGHVEGHAVFAFLDAFDSDVNELEQLKAHYRAGGLGDQKLKTRLNEILQELIRPIREKRKMLEQDQQEVLRYLKKGTLHAQEVTQTTLNEFKNALGLNYFKDIENLKFKD